MFEFIKTLFWLVVFAGLAIGVIALMGYNKLRSMSETIREAWSNIGVTAKKQISLINQLIDVVKGYQESEKLVMLKVSEDTSSAAAVAQMYQQSGMVLSSVNGMAQKFPELKANEQYKRLIDSIQSCETALENARQTYNGAVKGYNTQRSSIPHVFYAATLGFKAAPYLEFNGNDMQTEVGALQSFVHDDDGERLNQLIGAAGASAKRLGSQALSGGTQLAGKALEGGKALAEAAQEKTRAALDAREEKARAAAAAATAATPPEAPIVAPGIDTTVVSPPPGDAASGAQDATQPMKH